MAGCPGRRLLGCSSALTSPSANRLRKWTNGSIDVGDSPVYGERSGAKGAPVFAAKPSLEEELGINRSADDKPAKVAEAISKCSPDKLPSCPCDAVRALFADAA